MNNTDKDLYLEDGDKLKWFPKDKNYFLNCTTICYGRTRSGKSTIIKEILNLCKDDISLVFIISKSSISNSDYDGIVPKSCIKNDVTKEWLIKFLENQSGRVTINKTANELKNLKNIFEKIGEFTNNKKVYNQYLLMEQEIKDKTTYYTEKIEHSNKLDYAEKKQNIKEVQNIEIKQLKKLYKETIRIFKIELENIKNSLRQEEKICIDYLDFVPNALLVFDDCASEFKKWVKESSVIKELFYAGRWYNVTLIISAQDDKEIESELRKNSIVNIFTTQQAASSNFQRGANNFPKHIKSKAEKCIKRVFDPDKSNKKNHKKLVYLQTSADPFFYTIADLYFEGDFRIGCPGLWELDRKNQEYKKSQDNSGVNSFYEKYDL
jgi:hypothetical protein